MKRFNMLITLIMVCLGGFIGFDPNSPSQTANAEETRIRWVDIAYRSKFFNRLKPINKELPVKNW